MASTLTLSELRGAARLYREGVDGSSERLIDLIDEHFDELPELLGFPRENLCRLREHDDPVAVLVGTIEGAPRLVRQARMRAEGRRAAELAARLARSTHVDSGGTRELDVSTLANISNIGDHRHIVFGERGGVCTRKLAALFRELRHVTACSVILTSYSLDVLYTTSASRGVVRLLLQPVALYEGALVVPIAAPALALVAEERCEATVQPAPTVPEVTAIGDTPRSIGPARRHSPRPTFAGHLIEALLAAAAGGSP